MDKYGLRSIIVQILQLLSDEDRIKFHYLLTDQVPRSISDDRTIIGTLNLIESLFEQDKINETNFNLLIDVLEKIHRFDVAHILRDYNNQLDFNEMNKITKISEEYFPSLIDRVIQDLKHLKDSKEKLTFIEKFDDNDDHCLIHSIIKTQLSTKNQENFNGHFNCFQLKHSTLINSLFNRDHRFIFLIILMSLSLMISLTYFIIENRRKTNENIEKEKKIQDLNQIIKQFEDNQNNSMIRFGKIFGISTGFIFDDSEVEDFTLTHHLISVSIHYNDSNLETYEFQYSSSLLKKKNLLRSAHHGYLYPLRQTSLNDERIRITRIEGQKIEILVDSFNQTKSSIEILNGIRFHSRNGLLVSSYNGPKGNSFDEEIPGYYLGYLRGRIDHNYIRQIQCVWYRNKDSIFN